jgi:hypothetical protein
LPLRICCGRVLGQVLLLGASRHAQPFTSRREDHSAGADIKHSIHRTRPQPVSRLAPHTVEAAGLPRTGSRLDLLGSALKASQPVGGIGDRHCVRQYVHVHGIRVTACEAGRLNRATAILAHLAQCHPRHGLGHQRTYNSKIRTCSTPPVSSSTQAAGRLSDASQGRSMFRSARSLWSSASEIEPRHGLSLSLT